MESGGKEELLRKTAFDRLSRRFAERLGGVLGSEEDRVAVMAYGAYSLLYTAWSILLLIVFGVLTGTLTGILAVSLAASLLRRTSGGAHASSPHRCAWIGVDIRGCNHLGIGLFLGVLPTGRTRGPEKECITKEACVSFVV